MKLHSFTTWVNEILLPNQTINQVCRVGTETARCRLHELGFQGKAPMWMVMNALMLLHTEPSSLGRWSLWGSYMREMVPLLKLNKHLDCPPADIVTKTIMTSQLFKQMTMNVPNGVQRMTTCLFRRTRELVQ